MEIRGIDNVRGIDNNSKINKIAKKDNDSARVPDSADISKEAKQLAEEAKIRETMARVPDIREDKVQEAREKLQNGSYNKEEVMNTVAERLMKVLGL
ncbi:MAG: flagellar biosynthesis anti-sigma factor FlgM [Brevinematales bacterium]|jgi:anti-sigma28 factor (negative regulator of flagellin synthesis)